MAEPLNGSEMINQLLYGEHFKILEQRKNWSRIRLAFDLCEGWLDNKQFIEITEKDYTKIESEENVRTCNVVELVGNETANLMPIPLGSVLNFSATLGHHFDGKKRNGKHPKSELVKSAFLYLNAPCLWGGKTPFGIDCSGFVQMVYALNGHKLFRDVAQQAKQGEPLSFIEESEEGDLAFFDDRDGVITHVGMMMEDNYIIHCHGKVRKDRIDHSGIYNEELGQHTHKLRVIKKII